MRSNHLSYLAMVDAFRLSGAKVDILFDMAKKFFE